VKTEARTYLITGGTYLVSCSGALVDATARRVARRLERLVDGDAREIVLELRDIVAIDLTMLRQLVAVGRKASSAGTVATVACEDEGVARLLRLLGAEPELELAPTVPDAFAQVARRARGARPPAAWPVPG